MVLIKNLSGKELETFKSTFKIVGNWAPTVFKSPLNGQKYAVAIGSPWIPIPDLMTQEDVHRGWVKPQKKTTESITKIVKSSRGKGEYKVSFDGTWKCTCSGYGYRKSCSHIKSVKDEAIHHLKIKK